MGVVHGLKGDSGVIAVEVAVLDEVFDGVGDLFNYKHYCFFFFFGNPRVDAGVNVRA